jgi:subtilisin-like proprotein convertase family protein
MAAGPQIASVQVILHNLTHTCPSDLDILLKGPDGTALVLMSDAGGCPGTASTYTFTFNDNGFPVPPSGLTEGATYRPTDLGGWPDFYPPPAPGGTLATSLSAFVGKSPGGFWDLFVVDGHTGHRGTIDAWTLVLEYRESASTIVSNSLPGSGTSGPAQFYPSTAVAFGVDGRLLRVTAEIRLAHSFPDDVDVLLVGPGGQKCMLMSDAGGDVDLPLLGADLIFDDAALLLLPDGSPLTAGTYSPTNHAGNDGAETLPAPAPGGPYPTSLSVFAGTPPNGVWSLYARDDLGGDTGQILQWRVELITTTSAATPFFSIEAPAAFTTSSPFVYISTDVDDPSDALVTWRNAANGATGVARRTYENLSFFGATVPVSAGSNLVTFTLTNAAGETQSKSVTVTANAMTYTFSEGATGPFFDLDLALFNPGASTAPLDVTFLTPSGSFGPVSYSLGGRSRLKIPVESLASQFPALAESAVSAVINSTSALPIAAERSMFWDASRYGGHAGSAVTETSTRWQFAEGSQGFFDTFLLLSNAGAATANVTVTFLLESGSPVVKTYAVAAGTRFNVWAAVIPELVGKSFGIDVDSDVPITAERAMYFSGSSPRLFESGHESAGVVRASREWFFPEGATGLYFDTYILVSNPGLASLPVTFTYRTDTGVVVTKTITVAGKSRLTVNVEDQDALLANTAVATTVSAPNPIVAERAMYWWGGVGTWIEAHNSFGLTETAERWAVADGRHGGNEAYETYLLLVNPEPVDAVVTASFARAGLASPIQKAITVPADSRLNVTLPTHAPDVLLPSGVTEYSVLFETTNLTRIAVERATYWNSGGVVWAGGANVTGTRLR